MKRLLVLCIVVLASAGIAGAAPVDLDQPVVLASQRFEWINSYSSRAAGTYGQTEVTLAAGATYEFFTSNVVAGTTADPYLYLLNGAGTAIVAQDDDAGGSYNSKIVYTPSSAGTYLVRLRSYPRGRYGTCTLTLRRRPEPLPPTEIVLRPGDVLNGQVFEWRSSYTNRWQGAYGQYSIPMTAGTTYAIETSNASGGEADTVLYLFDPQGQGVAYDDDSGAGYQSKLLFRPTADGTFLLRLRAYTRGARGTCTLSLAGGASGNPLLPDLVTQRDYLEDVYVSTVGGSRLLRFSNSVANRGAGPLDVYGVVTSSGTTSAYQVVHNDDGTQTVHQVGTFSFAGHETHDHWHFDEFAVYRLVDPSTGATVASSEKVSFCLLDSTRYTAESLPNTPSGPVFTCEDQGISVGWADVYDADLEGQSINLAGVADGDYDLVSTVNPAGALHESDTTNGTASVRLRIQGSTVQVLD